MESATAETDSHGYFGRPAEWVPGHRRPPGVPGSSEVPTAPPVRPLVGVVTTADLARTSRIASRSLLVALTLVDRLFAALRFSG